MSKLLLLVCLLALGCQVPVTLNGRPTTVGELIGQGPQVSNESQPSATSQGSQDPKPQQEPSGGGGDTFEVPAWWIDGTLDSLIARYEGASNRDYNEKYFSRAKHGVLKLAYGHASRILQAQSEVASLEKSIERARKFRNDTTGEEQVLMQQRSLIAKLMRPSRSEFFAGIPYLEDHSSDTFWIAPTVMMKLGVIPLMAQTARKRIEIETDGESDRVMEVAVAIATELTALEDAANVRDGKRVVEICQSLVARLNSASPALPNGWKIDADLGFVFAPDAGHGPGKPSEADIGSLPPWYFDGTLERLVAQSRRIEANLGTERGLHEAAKQAILRYAQWQRREVEHRRDLLAKAEAERARRSEMGLDVKAQDEDIDAHRLQLKSALHPTAVQRSGTFGSSTMGSEMYSAWLHPLPVWDMENGEAVDGETYFTMIQEAYSQRMEGIMRQRDSGEAIGVLAVDVNRQLLAAVKTRDRARILDIARPLCETTARAAPELPKGWTWDPVLGFVEVRK